MKKNGFSHIRKWLWIYLLLVFLTTMATFLLVFNEIANTLPFQAGRPADTRTSIETNNSLYGASLKLRLLILLTAGNLAVLGLGFLWLRLASHQLNRPIRTIRRAIFGLARGKLNETIAIDTPDEFGQIASGVNELAANLQELLLHVWKQTGQCLVLLDHIQNNPEMIAERHMTLESLGHLKQLLEAINDLREMAKAYVFYDVRLEGEQTLAVNEPGQTLHTGREWR